MNELLRALVDLRDRQIQKARIQFSNRVSAIERDADNGSAEQLLLAEKYQAIFEDIEKQLDKDIGKMVKKYDIYQEMVKVKGVGPLLSAKMLSMIDIERAPTISSLWRYAGFAVVNGERERPVKGEKLHYNKRLKSTCYLLAGSFLKSNSPYRDLYDEARAKYEQREEWTDLHRHNAALRYMVKRFLAHLWLVWREIEGLPTRQPYVQEYMGHSDIDAPSDYGWSYQLKQARREK